MRRLIVLILALALPPVVTLAGPATPDEAEQQRQIEVQLKTALAAETDAEKIAGIAELWPKAADVDQRRRILDIAAGTAGPATEAFLIGLLTTEEDAGLRSQAATALGKMGSEKCLAPLAKTAASDRTTDMRIGCVGSSSSARRAATFALAQLAERFPKLADKAAAELRGLTVVEDAKDNESLWDARQQALYQITGDASLMQPFFERLKSDDPKVRAHGVVAFRFLNLDKAPPQIIDALSDRDPDVCLWAALVLEEIGDPRSVEPLMSAAANRKLKPDVRSNAIDALGRMRAKIAAGLMEELLADPDESVAANAAIALYRIAGKKTRQLPKGYDAD